MGLITSKLENNKLVLFLSGRVDSTNAEAVGAEIMEALSAPHDTVVLDLEDLEYISSAGLRDILRLRKAEPTLTIVNASSEVYDIFDMTGFAEMIPIEKAYRKVSVDGCAVIGKGAKGTVYRLNEDTIIKVYHDVDSLPAIRRERELARRAFVLGIPTAISYDVVKVGDKFGSVFELLAAKPFSKLMAEDIANCEHCAKEYAGMLKQIHSTTVKADEMPDVKTLIFRWLSDVAPYFDDAANAKLKSLVEQAPDDLTMIHGDYHTNNLMMQNGETLLIDMDTLSHGCPIFELANIHFSYVSQLEIDPNATMEFFELPGETSLKFWELFENEYFAEYQGEARVKALEKVQLVSYLRLLRHISRRKKDTAEGQKAIAYCAEKINDLLGKVDTLAL